GGTNGTGSPADISRVRGNDCNHPPAWPRLFVRHRRTTPSHPHSELFPRLAPSYLRRISALHRSRWISATGILVVAWLDDGKRATLGSAALLGKTRWRVVAFHSFWFSPGRRKRDGHTRELFRGRCVREFFRRAVTDGIRMGTRCAR